MLARSFGSEDPKKPKDVVFNDGRETSEFVSLLAQDEASARKSVYHNQVYLLVLNSISAILVFVFHLISLEGLLGIGLSVGLTIFVYKTTDTEYNAGSFDGSIMNWTLLSFAVITPMSAAIRMSFTRREQSLYLIASLKSTFLEIYAAHALWNWGKDHCGRAQSEIDWVKHSDETISEMLGVTSDLTRLLTLPDVSRARHKMIRQGKNETKRIVGVRKRLNESIVYRFGRLAVLCEILKREGLPPNEATRVRQWERIVLEKIEKIRTIKLYRTPQGLRSFCRLFSVFLPPFYAPFYAQMAHDLNSLGVAITFSILTSIALTALFETIYQMEDPFLPGSILDGVDVKRELIDHFKPQLIVLREQFFPGAAGFDAVQ